MKINNNVDGTKDKLINVFNQFPKILLNLVVPN